MTSELDIPPPGTGRAQPGLYQMSRHPSGVDPAMRKLMLGGGGVAALIVVAAVGWHFVQPRPTVVPVIEADSRPIKTRPDNPGGLQVAGQDEAILSGQGDGQAEALAPAPEVPAPLALKAQAVRTQKAEPHVAIPGATPAIASAGVTTAQTVSLPAAGQPAPLAAAPAALSAAAEQRPVRAGPASAAPGHATTLVQLAAMDTEQAAQAEWLRLAKRMPELIRPHRPAVVRAERDGHTIWRLRTGGFADVAQATAFCAQVRAKGGGCSIASF